MTSVLVTGSDGFLGVPLVHALRQAGYDVHLLAHADGDIADAALIGSMPATQHVFHLAARTFVPASWRDPGEFMRTNVVGTTQVLEFCRRHGAGLTYVSAYLYGNVKRLPVSEATEPMPNNPYALSKLLAERACRFYAEAHGVAVTILRPFNIYGPGQKAQFLIPELVKQVRRGAEIRVRDLAPKRDFVYVDDVVDALLRTLTPPLGYRVFNIGSGVSVSVRELIDIVQRVAGTRLLVFGNDDVRPNEIDDVYADITAARTELGWWPAVRLEDGLARLLSAASSASAPVS